MTKQACIRRLLSTVLIAVALSATTAFAPQALAKDEPWFKYESRHFVAHSNASKKKSTRIVEELELFRAAVLGVSGWRMPEGGPKAEILIVRNRGDFSDITPESQLSYVAMHHGGRYLFAINAEKFDLWIQEGIRHHYTHAMFSQMSFPYPVWYQEGFSRLVSMIEFRDRNRAFTIGAFPGGCRRRTGVSLEDEDLNALISGEWEKTEMREGPACERFLQSTLLAHYVTLGNDFANIARLHRYFGLMGSGQPSLAAFTAAFGMDANQLFEQELETYSDRMFVLVVDLDLDKATTDIERTPSDEAERQALIAEIKSLEVPFRIQDHLADLIATQKR